MHRTFGPTAGFRELDMKQEIQECYIILALGFLCIQGVMHTGPRSIDVSSFYL